MEGPSSSPAPRLAPRRPLLEAALAALIGAWLGSLFGSLLGAGLGDPAGPETSVPVPVPVLVPVLARALAATAVLAALAGLLLSSGARGGSRARTGRRSTLALLLLVAALSLLRAWGEAPPAWPAGPGAGRYWPSGRSGGVERGRIEGDPRTLALPAGMVRPGEWLRIAPGAEPQAPARGPVLRGQTPGPIVELAADEVQRLAPPPERLAARARAALCELRARAGERTERGLSDGRTRALVAAMLLGERGGLDPELSDRFTRTGTRHLLAISGLHVGLVAALIAAPLGWCLAALARGSRRAPRWLGKPGPWIVLLLAPLVPLSGAGAPVGRAFVAASLFALTRCLPPTRGGEVRRADPLSLLALAALLEVCARPGAAASISVRLSYAATLGLIVGVGPLARGLRRCLPAGGELPAVTRLGRPVPAWLRAPAQRLVDGLRVALAVSLAASLATLPVVWTRFGELGLAGILATPLALPPLAGLLAAGWAWLALPCAPLEAALGFLAGCLEGLLALADRLPGTPLPLPPRPGILLYLATAGALLASTGRAPRGLVRGTALLWAALLLPWRAAPAGLELHLLDVGHGTCAVLRAPGSPPLIFDAGSRDRRGVAREALAPLLASLEARGAIYALSHADADHSGALPWILERFPPLLWLGARTAQVAARLPDALPVLDPDVGRVELRLGARASPPLLVELLRGRDSEDNQGSRSLLVRWGEERILLAGDADDRGLARMLREGWLEAPLRLLLIPHHGSESRFLFPLLERTDPAEVWISASGDPPVVPELERRGLPWRSTGREGPLELHLGRPDAGGPPRPGNRPALPR